MASFGILPNELLEPVVARLLDRKIDDLDIVATRDLQNARLVCRTLHTIATPMLFENMVLDLKLWENGDLGMKRLVTFATTHPDLAKLVRRLQLQVPPAIWEMNFQDNRFIENFLLHQMTYEGWTSAQVAIIHDILAPLLQKCAAVYSTLRVLPNLYHVEHALSTHNRRTFRELESNVLDKTDLSVEHELLASVSEPLSFVNGCKLILGSLRPSITSLKLRKIPVCRYPYNGGRILLAAFRHLDLELYTQTFWDNRSEPVRLASVDAWRCSLAPLEQLRTLRLGGWKQWNNPIIPFYIDDLLIDRKDDANVSFLPHLKHLFFSDCFLRMQGLAIATSHASILQELELSRVTYDPSYCPQAWSEIGLLCKSALPILAYLRLAKTVTHFPRRATAPLDEMPIPERWNKGLKGVTSYEWRKGVHNPDVEVIGSRCPWKVEDIIVEEDCKRNFGGDRYLCSVEKERILEA